MRKRAQIHRHLEMLSEISSIMGAMKNISLMETHKLARFLAHQRRVLASIEAAAADFICHHPETAYRAERASSELIVALGSQRGFCGDFNETVVGAIHKHRREVANNTASLLVVGRKLAARLGKDPHVIAAFDGASVVEEIQPVLQRVMNVLSEVQTSAGPTGLLEITVFAHHEARDGVSIRSVLPRLVAESIRPFPYPPLLNVAAPVFFSQLVHHYLWAQMHDVFYSSLMAENRRRLRHMEGAMQRMEEKRNELQRKYNGLRQEEITEEIEVIMLSNDALQKHPRSGQAETGEA